MSDNFVLGYDYNLYLNHQVQIKIRAQIGHTIVVGGSGSGKSTAVLYWLTKLKKANINVELHIMDFKASHEFVGITDNYAEYEDIYDKLMEFYDMFCTLEEGGDGSIKILIIDEIAGMLSHLSMTKEGKEKADKVRQIMSSILMLARSKNCWLWLILQRASTSIFPASSGAIDNFFVYVGFGRLSVESRKSLFACEHIEEEEHITFGMGRGIVLIDGQELQTLMIPNVKKHKLLLKLQQMNMNSQPARV